MASSFTVCRLHTIGRGSLVKCLQKVDTFLHRNIGTNVVAVQEEKNGFKSLNAVQAERQEQAERSVLISCRSRTNEKKFLKYIANYGDIQKYFFMKAIGLPNQPSGKKRQAQTSIPINELIQRLSKEESIDQQITSLTEVYQLTEENCRLRFLVCSLLKDIAAGFFQNAPSSHLASVNGFGKLGCDLDMFLDLDGISGKKATMPKSGLFLEYQMKRANLERIVTRTSCPSSGSPSGFQCDLTANNRVAMKSTELLYLYGELDPRVRHLVSPCAVGLELTASPAAPRGLDLQLLPHRHGAVLPAEEEPPIIPTLDHSGTLQRRLYHTECLQSEDKSMIEDNDCTFVSDFSKIQLESNTETLEQLLCEFFEFYASFSFRTLSINIRKGKEQNKPEVAPLHIQNPFETTLNVSKNVNASQLDRFVAVCQESSWLIQQNNTAPSRDGTKGKANITPWGVSTLLLPSQVAGIKSRKRRIFESSSDRIKSLLESLKNTNNQQNQS
ncbi:Poly(A) RNA polymerase mitochondrial [Dissostichus eleginoides]|uniref:Poly(A) RNA polymerase mitochondrial n=1 Tax=Dissostichus eleginoides TaxID=100907 RepID=A0AAD9BJZ6_DISEL|nr:Poly(A) RNA polymerase mitochondrial [Dissostichus eleginoides]